MKRNRGPETGAPCRLLLSIVAILAMACGGGDGAGAGAPADNDVGIRVLGDAAGTGDVANTAGVDVSAGGGDVASGHCGPPQPANTQCKAGKWQCVEKTFSPWQADDCIEASCANKNKSAGEAITAAVAKAKACSVDEDCVIAQTSTQCGGTCGEAVNKADKSAITTVVKWVDAHICPVAGTDSPCPYATPGCIQPKPGCVNKACVYTKPQPI